MLHLRDRNGRTSPWSARLVAAASCAPLLACGASYQSVYEGDVRFEHCYRLDEDPSVPSPRKWGCWREWTRAYTDGQTRERIEYAMSRERVLSKARAPDALNSAPAPRQGAIACPAPTSAFAPPPPVLPRGKDTASFSDAQREASSAPPPGSGCSITCGESWSRCGQTCSTSPCQTDCDSTYRGCMKRCF